MTRKPVQILIQKTLRARRLEEVLEGPDLNRAYRKLARLLHPDVCHLPGASQALSHLNRLRADYLKGQMMEDDAGQVKLQENTAVFYGERQLLKQSQQHYRQLYNRPGKAAQHFKRYLPKSMCRQNDQLLVSFEQRSVCLAGRTLTFPHVRWILSRLLEFCAWLSQEGYVHAGIQPESVWVVPETHGIVIGSFYHLSPMGIAQQSVSAAYRHWYPEALFVKKRAEPYIDLELSKRLACYLLGSRAGNATALHGKCHPAFIRFLNSTHRDAYRCYDEYRRMISNYFDQQFYSLNL